jgi:tRNA U38,U39,U40 pseudouridine synthase TruA
VARTFRLTLEFDGAEFEGWQVQPDGRRTVQGELEIALARVTRERVRPVDRAAPTRGCTPRGSSRACGSRPRSIPTGSSAR